MQVNDVLCSGWFISGKGVREPLNRRNVGRWRTSGGSGENPLSLNGNRNLGHHSNYTVSKLSLVTLNVHFVFGTGGGPIFRQRQGNQQVESNSLWFSSVHQGIFRSSTSNFGAVLHIMDYFKFWSSISNYEAVLQILKQYFKFWNSTSNSGPVLHIMEYFKFWRSTSNSGAVFQTMK